MLANYQRRHPRGVAMRAGYCLVFNSRGLAITNVTTLHLISLNAQIHSELDLDE